MTNTFRLTGARVLTDGDLHQTDLTVADGAMSFDGHGSSVDASGYLILPGIIDLHGDAFEHHIAPRPSAPFPLRVGLVGTDRDAAVNGVTTAWMAQSWSWEGGMRGPEFALDLLNAHAAYKAEALTDLRIQIRCETHTMDTETALIAAIAQFGIDYVIFNNHLDEALALSQTRPELIDTWAYKSGRSAAEHMALVHAAKERDKEVPRYLCNLASAFDRLGVRYGSHDDTDGAARERYSMIGAKVCEFPTAMGPAMVARNWGDPVVMGAPNVVRGGSQAGNIAATELIAQGCCDALVSDYYYPALPMAAFALADNGLLPLAAAWEMISTAPARIMGLTDRGRIAQGLRADLAVVNAETRVVEGTVAQGRWTHLCGPLAERVMSARTAVALAAE